MKMFTKESLLRGSVLVDYALSEGGRNLPLDASDLIGIAAQYIGRVRHTGSIRHDLAEGLHPRIADRVMDALDMFNDARGRGLWKLGDGGKIELTNWDLSRMFPHVNKEQSTFTPGMASI